MIKPFISDSNFYVATFDQKDVHARKAALMWKILEQNNIEIVILDCVVNKTISALGKRLNEKGRQSEMINIFDRVDSFFRNENIFWTNLYARDFFDEIKQLLRKNKWIFNFHDALIALVAKKEGLKHILSFDRHFDLFPWIIRISEADQLEKSFKTKQIE
jgi:predicted nucleic acid-binding protein